ncbi:MAG: O-antigen ligase family protein [Rhodospirillales bacterium]
MWARYGRGACIAGLVFAAAAVAQTQAETPVIAFAAGGVAAAVFFMLSKISERRVRIVSAALIAVLVLLLPAAVAATPHVYDILEHFGDSELPKHVRRFVGSLFHRLAIWQAAVGHIAEAPLAGLGFDTARALYDSGDLIKYRFTDNVGNALLASNFEPIPLHPHNAALQIWLELGAIGALIAAGLLARMFWSASAALNSAPRFFMCAVFFSGLAAASAAFGAWQSWWLGALFMTAAFAAVLAKTPPPSPAGDVQKQV